MLKFIRKIIRTDLLIGAMKKFFATVMYCCVVSFPLMVSAQEQKPNVIYILADDLGYGDVGYNGQELIETPELDKLAHNGMRFTNHYCGNAVCAPSRASLLMGQHPGHAYIRSNSPGYPDGQTPIPADSETLGKLMQRAGTKQLALASGDWVVFMIKAIPTSKGLIIFMGTQIKC